MAAEPFNPAPVRPGTATPPGLLLAALIFWGWQSGWLWPGVFMGVILELPRLVPWRRELREEDFRRLWNFSFLLALGVVIYLFTANDAGGGPVGTGAAVARKAGLSGLAAGMGLLRLLPAVWFFFLAAQVFSTRQTVPLGVVSWLVRRWQQRDPVSPDGRWANLTYPYFMVCLFAAGIRENDGSHWYFWGQSLLAAWALWPLRARRVRPGIWLALLAIALAGGYAGTRGIGRLEQVLNNYNAQWMTRLLKSRMEPDKARTSIGRIGQLKLSSAIVLRVEPLDGAPVPTYLREASYNKYNSQIWQTAGPHRDFDPVNHEATNAGTWMLAPNRPVRTAVRISAYLDNWNQDVGEPEGLLPLPDGCARLEDLPADLLELNPFGTVLVTGPGLVIFRAGSAPAASRDAPPDTNLDLLLPPNETDALDRVIAAQHLAGLDREHTLSAVARYFANQFTYTLLIRPRPPGQTNETPVGDFLLRSHAGYCEYFATASVLLLRRLNIPARYATGYYVHEISGHEYVVRGHDAHAWCLVWNPQTKQWDTYDTTPATEANAGWHWGQALGDSWSWLKFQLARFRWGQANLRQYLLWIMVPVLALSLYQIFFRRTKGKTVRARPARAPVPPGWPGRDSEFYRLEARLATRAVPRQPGEPLGPWLERVLAEPTLAAWREPLQRLLLLHYRHRFDPQGLSAADRARLARETADCLDQIEGKTL